jgi:hypothetical protein
MSKRDYVREELADIERQVAGKSPDAIGVDMSDLAAIGLARYDRKITPEQIAKLVRVARTHGRNWEEIGSRLGMSAEEARNAYDQRPSDAPALSVFVSYSHNDERYRQALDVSLAQLKRNTLISVWHDREIIPGQQWDKQIDKDLETADIVLVLVSPDFLASEYVDTREMQRAIERHHAGRTVVVPVILRPADWQNSPLGDLQPLPSAGRPVSTWRKRDQAWLDVFRGLRQLISSRD